MRQAGEAFGGFVPVFAGLLLVAVGTLPAGETAPKTAESRIVAASMFKNGLAIITRDVEVGAPGEYLVADVPEPVHGTFWISSDYVREARVSRRTVEEKPAALPAFSSPLFQESLVGRRVTLYLKDKGGAVSGTVLKLTGETEKGWDRTYRTPDYGGQWSSYRPWAVTSPPTAHEFIALKTETGTELIAASQIYRAQLPGDGELRVKVGKPVLRFRVARELKQKPAVVRLSYLAKGLCWAPSYRLDLLDEKKAALRQKAVIRNELADLQDAELHLISGYPSIQFEHVLSPLAANTTLSAFFAQLNQRLGGASHAITRQQDISFNASHPDAFGGGGATVPALRDGVDLHYQAVGRWTLGEGESLYLDTAASRQFDYQRIVLWDIPDSRDERGRHYPRGEEEEKFRDQVWDAVRFKNPFGFPMTTAPATTYDASGRFLGQQMSYWTDPGEELSVPVTRTLSVRVRHTEQELPDKRERILIAGNDYQRTEVEAELTVTNHRRETITLIIKRRFSGELLNAEGDPKKVLREEGAWSINKRQELIWEKTLPAGQTLKLKCRYEVLIDV